MLRQQSQKKMAMPKESNSQKATSMGRMLVVVKSRFIILRIYF